MICRYIDQQTSFSDYMMFPRFLLDTDLSETAKLLYMLLLDRTRLSITSPGWTDSRGHTFIRYSITDLRNKLGKSKTTIEDCLRSLEEHDLIRRKRQGIGKSNLIYVLLPQASFSAESGSATAKRTIIPVSEKPDMRGPENWTSHNQNSGHHMTGKVSTIKNNKSKNYRTITKGYDGQDSNHINKTPYEGRWNNDDADLSWRNKDYSYEEGESL